jgi:hypothetical protein
MSRPKSWLPRLVQITEALEASDVPHYDRGDIERIFDIKPSAAKDLMKIVGVIPGGVIQNQYVSRGNLLAYLRNSPDAQDAMAELARRKKLAVALRKAGDEARLRAVHLPVTSADEWTRFQDLPNVSVEPGRLTVVFTDPLDLFTQLYKFAKAAGGEWDVFVKMCDPPAVKAEMPGDAGAAVSGEYADIFNAPDQPGAAAEGGK